MGLTFFGLTSDYDNRVMDQIFDMMKHCGGFGAFDTIYNMPVNIRSYYYYKLAKSIDEENARQEAANKKK